ncbi:hypothetical protein M408DRAFT_331804 [Serendipita vermifera MAFF 305830]|uniref:protein disulfide-isomerase n=1 Tax=Serendipita vermifera MAFF 305830 TaxID=933852 RepID=A0A0C2X542_SERVB|nr:hypothetical protein M408DRAFT_331804 [Serendipita vermifera MAFF 305830]
MKIRAIIVAFLPLGVAWASNVLELDSTNFEQHVGAGKPPALVEFYAPWCGHCKNLAPIYEQLGDAFAHAKDKVSIVKVDADGNGRDVGQKYGVKGFPTLKWFKGDGSEPEDYSGARELDDLAGFVSKKASVRSSIKPPPPSAVHIADVDNFRALVMDPTKDVLVAFTAPWCGHCKSMKPILEKVAQTFKSEKNCIIVNMDADAQQNKDIAKEYSVTSYPTLKFFPRSDSTYASTPLATDKVAQEVYTKYMKHPIEYDQARTEEAFVKYLNDHCGTNRAVGGGLNDVAGRLGETWDSWAAEIMGFAGSVQADAKERMVEVANLMKAGVAEVKKDEEWAAKWYARVAEKVAHTPEWIEKESKRLTSILNKKTLAPEKLEELKMKVNILAAFIEKKGEQYTEEAKAKVEEAKAKVAEKAGEIRDEL